MIKQDMKGKLCSRNTRLPQGSSRFPPVVLYFLSVNYERDGYVLLVDTFSAIYHGSQVFHSCVRYTTLHMGNIRFSVYIHMYYMMLLHET